jgi:hypothetical protein
MRFHAVYIPADVHWHNQLMSSLKRLSQFPLIQQRLSKAAVTTNVFHAACTTMTHLLEYELGKNVEKETELSRFLITLWQLPPTIPKLADILVSLDARISDIQSWFERMSDNARSDDEVSVLPSYTYLEYTSAVVAACAEFDRLFYTDDVKKWALCFDELELAPDWFVVSLLTDLRSMDERILLKLSTGPILRLTGLTQAKPAADFHVIRLWSHEKKTPRPFCERLVKSLLEEAFQKEIDPQSLFGTSPLEREEERDYEPGSEGYEMMKELAQMDSTFSEVLHKHGINPSNPTTMDQLLRHDVLRKAKPGVLHRHAYFKFDRERKLVRRTPPLPVYYGKEALYDISDGNPRWLKGFVKRLLEEGQNNLKSGEIRVPPKSQSDAFTGAANEFTSLIKTLPEALVTINKRAIHVSDVLRSIGTRFNQSFLYDPFTLDPIGTFRVDNNTPQVIRDLLWAAVYQGAIVFVDPDENDLDPSLSDKRFRLSYLLSVSFFLPLRLMKPVQLSKCLDSVLTPGLTQQELFSGIRS